MNLLRVFQRKPRSSTPRFIPHNDTHTSLSQGFKSVFVREIIANVDRHHLSFIEIQSLEQP
jgi:hypothetical protein